MYYIITILIVTTLIANFTGKIDSIQFLILIVGLTIMSMLITIDNKIEKLSAGQKEKEEKR